MVIEDGRGSLNTAGPRGLNTAAWPPNHYSMPILKALGFGVALLVLKFLVPAVFDQLERTVIAFLAGAEMVVNSATNLAAAANTAQPVSNHFTLPQTPQILR